MLGIILTLVILLFIMFYLGFHFTLPPSVFIVYQCLEYEQVKNVSRGSFYQLQILDLLVSMIALSYLIFDNASFQSITSLESSDQHRVSLCTGSLVG